MTELLSCETCAYLRRKPHDMFARETIPVCCRKPPTVVFNKYDVRYTVWPEVKLNDLCGEWSATFGGKHYSSEENQ